MIKPLIKPLEDWFLRRSAILHRAGAARLLMWTVPLLFGVLSVLLGQDDNWDLRNYHWYNPYALLNGRLDLDMAPGQWQSYFNPTIDVPYYVLSQWLAPPVIGFLYGTLHGLNFLLVLFIVRNLLGQERGRVPLLLALAGLTGVGFLSEIGNTMGDNMTSLLVLAALALVLRRWDTLRAGGVRALLSVAGAGLLMGLGTGLKMTNVSFAVALCLAMLVLPLGWMARVRLSFGFGVGVLAGMAVTAGYWFMTMWQRFGNPVFPQFNDIFLSPLAQAVGVIDHYHMPKNVWQALFWPFVFTAKFTKVSELVLRQTIWPVLYAIALAAGVWYLVRRYRHRPLGTPLTVRARFVLVFFAIGYLVWMKMFGIYRYLVPIELLAPLAVWLLLQRMGAPRRLAGWTLVLTSLSVFPFTTWGHAPWADKSFSATLPVFAQPAQSVVFTAHGHPPMGWMVPQMPRELRVIALAGGFPESPAWLARMHATMAARGGPHFVMLGASKNPKEAGRRRKQAIAETLGLTGSALGCYRLQALLESVRLGVRAKSLGAGDPPYCRVELLDKFQMDLAAMDKVLAGEAGKNLARYGLQVDAAGCRSYPAAVGGEPYPYLLCPVVYNRPSTP